MHPVIIRLSSVRGLCGLSRSTVYQHIAEGVMTTPVALGARAVGWPVSEIEAINRARIAGNSTEQIRSLVEQLHAARKAA